MRIAKADLVPTEANLLEEYRTFAELEAACREFCEQVNARAHRETRRPPVEMLAEERARLHPLPRPAVHGRVRHDPPGELGLPRSRSRGCATRCRTSWSTPGSGSGSTATSWSSPPSASRRPGARSPATPAPPRAARRSATSTTRRHRGRDRAGERTPRATSAAEAAFLALGPGAGVLAGRGRRGRRPRSAPQDGRSRRAGQAARRRRRSTRRSAPPRSPAGSPRTTCCASSPTRPAATRRKPTARASETHSLQPGTSAWSGFGITAPTEASRDPA